MTTFQPFKFPDEDGNEIQVELADAPEQPAAPAAKAPAPAAQDDEIEVVDDTPEQDRGRPALTEEVPDPTDAEMEAYSVKVQDRIKKLTHARHDERRKAEKLERERQELERVARAMMEENQRLKQYVQSGEQEYTKVATSAAELELAQARKLYKDAYDAGDADQLLKAQEALFEAQNKVQAAKNFKPMASQEPKSEVQPPQSQARQQPDERTLNWKAKNQWFGAPGYEEITSFAMGLHTKLINTGVDPRTDAYFEALDSRIKETFPKLFGAATAEPTGTPAASSKAPATVVAPATRSTGTKKIRLTTTQLATAQRLGITPQQYAAELAKLEKANG
jgi:hypothetical protein